MKRIWQLIIIIPILIGAGLGVYIGVTNQVEVSKTDNKLDSVFGNASSKYAKVKKFYSFGTSLNIEGEIEGISKDNFEGIKFVVTDGLEDVRYYNANASFENGNLYFNTNYINNSINLEDLKENEYYVLIRLRLNNSKDYKYYLLLNESEYSDIEYYTLTKSEENQKIDIAFKEINYNDKKLNYLSLKVKKEDLPEDVYDFAIDAGHGGTDKGEKYNEYTESDIMLEYAEKLKTALEAKGYKVKLTRDRQNTDDYNNTNMYNSNGRISIACASKAKYMISLHLNPVTSKFSGFEVYTPNDCELSLAKSISSKLNAVGLPYSSLASYKISDGVYTQNYTKEMIERNKEQTTSYEPYPLTTSTPYLYTIREVGGIATHAYVDGRNKNYDANRYYNSNQGIECYQIYLGYINKDIDYILNSQEQIVNAIADAF